MAVSRLRVPRSHREILAKIGSWDNELWDSITVALSQNLFHESELSASILECNASFNDEECDAVAEVFVSLAGVMDTFGMSPAEIGDAVGASEDLELTDSLREILSERIKDSLELPSARIAARAAVAVTSYERTFYSARILTDLRPIFANDATDPPLAATVSHALRIDYAKTANPKSIYLTLDEDDLKTLEKQVQRALEKTQTLKSLLDSIGLPLYDIEEA